MFFLFLLTFFQIKKKSKHPTNFQLTFLPFAFQNQALTRIRTDFKITTFRQHDQMFYKKNILFLLFFFDKYSYVSINYFKIMAYGEWGVFHSLGNVLVKVMTGNQTSPNPSTGGEQENVAPMELRNWQHGWRARRLATTEGNHLSAFCWAFRQAQ
jgi:hypothetical protein